MANLRRRRTRPVDFRLGNGEVLNRDHPDTFFIPARAVREALRPGDLVKLLFEIVDPVEDMPTAERMWVQVVEVQNQRYVGSLDNDPRVITSVRLGSLVEFGPEHVIATWGDSQ